VDKKARFIRLRTKGQSAAMAAIGKSGIDHASGNLARQAKTGLADPGDQG
jgi:hypothetical protein